MAITKLHLYRLLKLLGIISLFVLGFVALAALTLFFMFMGWIDVFDSIPSGNLPQTTSRYLSEVIQREVPAEEFKAWPEYSDPEVGITLKYPPHLTIHETSGRACCISGTNRWRQTFYSKHFTISPPQVGDAIYYGQPTNDRFIVRVENQPFNLKNVTKIGRIVFFDTWSLRWWYPEKFTLANKEGYYIPFFSSHYLCDSEHYAFPSMDGQKIIKLSFVGCPQEEVNQNKVIPYRKAILSSVQWTL